MIRGWLEVEALERDLSIAEDENDRGMSDLRSEHVMMRHQSSDTHEMHPPNSHSSETDNAQAQDHMIPPPVTPSPSSQEGQRSIGSEKGDDNASDDHSGVGLEGDGMDTVVQGEGSLIYRYQTIESDQHQAG